MKWLPMPTAPGGIKRWVAFDEKGEAHFKTETPMANVSAIVDGNKQARNHTTGRNADGTMQRVASIPYAVGLKWLSEEGWWFEDPACQDRLRKKLMCSDWMHLRTGGGSLAMGQNGEIR